MNELVSYSAEQLHTHSKGLGFEFIQPNPFKGRVLSNSSPIFRVPLGKPKNEELPHFGTRLAGRRFMKGLTLLIPYLLGSEAPGISFLGHCRGNKLRKVGCSRYKSCESHHLLCDGAHPSTRPCTSKQSIEPKVKASRCQASFRFQIPVGLKQVPKRQAIDEINEARSFQKGSIDMNPSEYRILRGVTPFMDVPPGPPWASRSLGKPTGSSPWPWRP